MIGALMTYPMPTAPTRWARVVCLPLAEYGGRHEDAGGQRVIVIPSHDLVVVRLGHMRGDDTGMRLLNDAVEGIVGAVTR
jgi:hypothetical protein